MITASAERAHQPVIPYHEKEDFPAVVAARAARRPRAGALIVRRIRAFPATPGPAMGRQCAGPASQQYREQKGDAG
jgi:hypothetical protein